MDSDLNSSNVADQSASFAADDTLPEDGSVVTMVDVLEQAKEQEADANAVLGGADDKVCTYLQVRNQIVRFRQNRLGRSL